MSTTDALYERFKTNLAAVNGECSLATKADAGKVVADLFREKGLKTTCVAETDFLRELGIVPALKEAGIEVFTDHIRLHAETAQGGISEVQYGIADLITHLVRMSFSYTLRSKQFTHFTLLLIAFPSSAKEKRLSSDKRAYFFFNALSVGHWPPDLAPHASTPVAGHHRAVPSATLDKGFSCREGL